MHNEYTVTQLFYVCLQSLQTTNWDKIILETGLFFVRMFEILTALSNSSPRI